MMVLLKAVYWRNIDWKARRPMDDPNYCYWRPNEEIQLLLLIIIVWLKWLVIIDIEIITVILLLIEDGKCQRRSYWPNDDPLFPVEVLTIQRSPLLLRGNWSRLCWRSGQFLDDPDSDTMTQLTGHYNWPYWYHYWW